MTNSDDLVQVREVNNEPEARIIVGFLNAQGIEAMIQQDDAGNQIPSLEESQGVQILVSARDAETAASLLAELDSDAEAKKDSEEE